MNLFRKLRPERGHQPGESDDTIAFTTTAGAAEPEATELPEADPAAMAAEPDSAEAPAAEAAEPDGAADDGLSLPADLEAALAGQTAAADDDAAVTAEPEPDLVAEQADGAAAPEPAPAAEAKPAADGEPEVEAGADAGSWADQATDGDPLAEPGEDRSDFAAELAAAAPKRWWNKGTIVLGVLIVLGAGFVGGAYVGKSAGDDDNGRGGRGGGRGGANFPGGGGRGDGQNGGGGRGGNNDGQGRGGRGGDSSNGQRPGDSGSGGGGAITGTVKLVDGTTVYVTTADGEVVAVRTGSKTAVTSARPVPLKQLTAGTKVTVAGATDAEGNLTATSITGTAK